jgi:hypothetical protein
MARIDSLSFCYAYGLPYRHILLLARRVIMTGVVVITRDEQHILRRYPTAVKFFPYMWWCPLGVDDMTADVITLETLQWGVGGYIEAALDLPKLADLAHPVVFWANEDGIVNGLQFCPWQPAAAVEQGRGFFGNLVLCKHRDEDNACICLTLEEARSTISADVWNTGYQAIKRIKEIHDENKRAGL